MENDRFMGKDEIMRYEETGFFAPKTKEDLADLMDITRIMRHSKHNNSSKKLIKIVMNETSMSKERAESILRYIAKNS